MKYTLNDYSPLFKSDNPRIEVYPNNEIAASLLVMHKDNGEKVLSISDCIPDEAVTLPMPYSIMQTLDTLISTEKTRVVVVGIDAYLSLLDEQNINAFFNVLRNRIDSRKINAAFLLSNGIYQEKLFSNPKYKNSLDVVQITGKISDVDLPRVNIVSSKWINNHNNPSNYKLFLAQLGPYLPTPGDHDLVFKQLKARQAGLGRNIVFFLNIKQIAEHFYGISVDLEENIIEDLLTHCLDKDVSPESFLENEFDKNNINKRLAIKRLLELREDSLWSAYVWMLRKKTTENSYLSTFLSQDITQENFLRKYVIDTAIVLMNDQKVKEYALERSEALDIIKKQVESLIIEFISRTSLIDGAIRFLTCGTNMEHCEIIRRASQSDLKAGLHDAFGEIYPVLSDYMSSDKCFENPDLSIYFRQYRQLKLKNCVTPDFVEKAFRSTVPSSIATRASALTVLAQDSLAGLLVVDALGAEYLPLMLAGAKRRAMKVESFDIVTVNLPTSTEYNKISWPNERLLEEVKEIDNIAHNGAAKNESCSFERNLAAAFDVFDTDIFNRIADGLTKYSRVVVTGDHGTSRLAVIAHNKSLVQTLPWSSPEPLDWRYSIEQPNKERPSELESQYNTDDRKTYWVVRGYNRLPKRGNKLNELHGGASLEERLVPLIVFSRDEPIEIQNHYEKTMEQLVEKDEFNI